MIALANIDEHNFEAVIALHVHSDQEHFVANNLYSLAQSYIYRNNGDVFPLAVLDDSTVIGFLLLEKDYDEQYYLIWRMMIDKQYQGKGFGQELVRKVIELAKTDTKIKIVKADYVKGNKAMQHILMKIGFVQIAEEENEIINAYIVR